MQCSVFSTVCFFLILHKSPGGCSSLSGNIRRWIWSKSKWKSQNPPLLVPTLEKDDDVRQNIAGSSRQRRWRCRTSWWPSTPISRASSGGPQLTFSSMRMSSQVLRRGNHSHFFFYDANLKMVLILLLSAFTAFNEEHFKQALERLDYVFAKYIFKVTSSQILFQEYRIKLKKNFRETIYFQKATYFMRAK